MRFTLLVSLYLSLYLNACGYHLVGQGKSLVMPASVVSASLESTSNQEGKPLLRELRILWEKNEYLPPLQDEEFSQKHVVMRVEQSSQSFHAIAFDASGIALQYRLQLSASLNMYQEGNLIWQSGLVSVAANMYEASDPSVVEAEKTKLTAQLQQQWANQVMASLQSGF